MSNIVTESFGKLAKSGVEFCAKTFTPKVLTGVCVGSIFGTAVATTIGTVKAVRACDKVKEEKKVDKLTLWEVVKISWPYYILPATTIAVGIGSAVGSYKGEENQKAILAAGLQAVATDASDIIEATKEVVDEKQMTEIKEKAAEKKVERADFSDANIQNFGRGDDLFLEPNTGLILRGDWDTLRSSKITFNEMISEFNKDCRAYPPTWGDWWDILGIEVHSKLKNVECVNEIEFNEPYAIWVESLHRSVAVLDYREVPFSMEDLYQKLKGRLPWE